MGIAGWMVLREVCPRGRDARIYAAQAWRWCWPSARDVRLGHSSGSARSQVCAEGHKAQKCCFAIRRRPPPTMAEPKHAGPALVGPHDPPGDAPRADILFTAPLVVIQTATAAGYGLWMVLGTSLALGLYPDGRGEVLVPLSIGLVFVSLGLIATCLRLPFAQDW